MSGTGSTAADDAGAPAVDGMTVAPVASAVPDVPATLAAWRASGAARLDPVRFAYLEALARRVQDHQGDVRVLLDARLAAAVAAYAQRVQAPQPVAPALSEMTAAPATPATPAPAARLARPAAPRPARKPAPPPSGPLAELARLLAPAAAGPRTAPELKALRVFRRSWTQRKSEQQLEQSQAVLPENAGPLHSQALVLRALQLMRSLSPEYLVRFMAHAETLLWLEQAQGASLPAVRNVVRGAAGDAPPAAGAPAASTAAPVTPAAGAAARKPARKSRTRQP